MIKLGRFGWWSLVVLAKWQGRSPFIGRCIGLLVAALQVVAIFRSSRARSVGFDGVLPAWTQVALPPYCTLRG